MYTLNVICPHCTRRHAITEWPHDERTPVLFTCLPKYGGCGGQALVEPPDVQGFPNLEHAFVAATPLTPAQAAYAQGFTDKP